MMLKAEVIQKGLVAIAVFGMLLLLVGWRYGTFQATGYDSLKAETDLRSVLTVSDQAPGTLDKLVVKWQGNWTSYGDDPAAMADRIADQLNIPAVSKVEENGHTVYRSVGRSGELKIRLNVMEQLAGQWYTVVQLESSHAGREQLIRLHKLCAEQLAAVGVQAVWNTSIQHSLKSNEPVDQLMKLTETRLAGSLSIKAKERYTDATTVAVSYEAPKLPLAVQSGEHQVHMQMAVHEDEEHQDTRITIGFPLITIEY